MKHYAPNICLPLTMPLEMIPNVDQAHTGKGS